MVTLFGYGADHGI
jgi:hypothetical protein